MARTKFEVPDFLAELDAAVGDDAVAVAFIDLDGFAAINVRHGHAAGDRVMAAFEKTLRGSLPKDSVVTRVGGDEYLAGIPGHAAESALIVLEEVRAHFASHPVRGVEEPVDASIGIASRPPHAHESAELVRCAHQALMRAKREGRGRIAIYVEEKMVLKSNYYSRASLDQLTKLSTATARTEASLLREALDDLFAKHRDQL